MARPFRFLSCSSSGGERSDHAGGGGRPRAPTRDPLTPPSFHPARPAYLISNAAGPAKYVGKDNSHFSPASALFAVDDESGIKPAARRRDIVVSDLGFFGAIAAIAGACAVFGPVAVGAYYGVPYLVTNLNLVLITYLQHTDSYVPHYREAEFTWLRGALATVDRSYGWLLDTVFHHISDTHVVHHLFSEMPFYHAQEATRIARDFLKDHYLCDHTPVPLALWRAWSACRFVDDEGAVVFLKGSREFNETLAKKSIAKKE